MSEHFLYFKDIINETEIPTDEILTRTPPRQRRSPPVRSR